MGCRESELWDREDLVQKSLLEAFRALETFADEREGALAHWLATPVQNNLTDHQRRRKARKRDIGGSCACPMPRRASCPIRSLASSA